MPTEHLLHDQAAVMKHLNIMGTVFHSFLRVKLSSSRKWKTMSNWEDILAVTSLTREFGRLCEARGMLP